MKIVKVTYTTRPDYSEQNQHHIQNVLADLKKANHPGIHYLACLSPDHKTFIHTGFFKSDEDQKFLNELPSFRFFQEQLKSSGPEVPPKQEMLTLIGSYPDIFNA